MQPQRVNTSVNYNRKICFQSPLSFPAVLSDSEEHTYCLLIYVVIFCRAGPHEPFCVTAGRHRCAAMTVTPLAAEGGACPTAHPSS